MYDATAAYRQSQVTATSPAGQVVLLYEGAIRFAAQSVQRLEAGDLVGSHNASLRAQEILAALQESLDLSAGDVATHLDALYDYMLERLAAGNLHKEARPAREVIALLRDLLSAWRAIAAPAAPVAAPATPQPTPNATAYATAVPAPALRTGLAGAVRA